MRKTIGLMLVLCICMGLALAQDAAKKSASGGNAAAEVKQLEADWIAAQLAGDADKLGAILADNWVGLGPDGVKMTKKQYLADYKSGASKFTSVEAGPLDALVLGNVVVVQGSDTEKSTYKGKDTSGKYVWMDVYHKNKEGKWQAVRSEVTKVQ
jgi:ketosteroid isomerase-like protein